MNNTRAKNVILGIEDMNVMPYVGSNSLKISEQMMDAVSMNNVFTQLVNNDLFLENSVCQTKYQIGPKTLSSDTQIDSQINGTKWYEIGDETFAINHKIDNGTIGTDNLIQTTIADQTNFIKQFGQYIIAGTNCGIYYSTDGMNFTLLSEAVGQDAFLNDFKMFILTDGHVLEAEETTDYDVPITLYNLNDVQFACAQSINYDSEQNKIYVGTCDGRILVGSYISKDVKIVFKNTYSFDENPYQDETVYEINVGNVNDVQFLSEYDSDGNRIGQITRDNFILATTDNGIYQSKRNSCLQDIKKVSLNYEIVGSEAYNKETFIATRNSISKVTKDGSVQTLAYGLSSEHSQCRGLKKDRKGKLYVISDSSISSINSNGESFTLEISSSEYTFRDIDTMGDQTMVACQDGIRTLGENGFAEGVLLGNLDVLQIFASRSTRSDMMYARTSDNSMYCIEGETEHKMELPKGIVLNKIIPNENDTVDVSIQSVEDSHAIIYHHSHQGYGKYSNFEKVNYTLYGYTCGDFCSISFLNGFGHYGTSIVSFDGDYSIYRGNDTKLTTFPSSMINGDNVHSLGFYTYDGNRYVITIDNTVYTFTGDNESLVYKRISQDKIKANKITKIDNNVFLIGTEAGLYKTSFSGSSLITPYRVNTSEDLLDVYRVIKTTDMENVPKYLILTDQYVRKGEDYRKTEDFITIGRCSTGSETVARDIIVQDMYHYCIGSECGTYNTHYEYVVSNDFDVFDEQDFKNLYESLSSEIENDIDNAVNGDHVSEHHNSESIITLLNKKMMTDFSNLSSEGTWPTVSSDSDFRMIRNDFVKTVDFGSYGDGRVQIHLENYLLSAESTTFTYILKTWYSGMRELYIYIPTTNTYYLPHNEGCPNCSLYNETMLRKNLMQFGTDVATTDGDVNSHCSKFTIELDNTEFTIDSLMEVQANGNSLPLRIYKDSDAVDRDGPQANMFHSFILPTVLVKKSINNVDESEESESNNHIFKFACFGTDSQAVKIQFYDSSAFVAKEIFTVVFNANGGEGVMDNQTVIYDAEKSKRLRTNMFTYQNGSRKFLGWSCYPSPSSSSDVNFADRAYIGLSYLPQDIRATLKVGGRVNLYAVWGNYDLDSDASTLTLKSTNEEFYIDSVTIDPDTKYGNNVVISYGD